MLKGVHATYPPDFKKPLFHLFIAAFAVSSAIGFIFIHDTCWHCSGTA